MRGLFQHVPKYPFAVSSGKDDFLKKFKKITGIALMAALFCAFSFKYGHAANNMGAVEARVKKTASRLEGATGYKARLFIGPEETKKDAFVLPDGTIYITSGLVLATDSDDELAFILAHEISHAMAKDHKLFVPEFTSVSDMPDFLLREINADLNGVVFAKKAGFRPEASMSLLTRLTPPSNRTLKSRLETLSIYLKTISN